jgi:hypothetical protein
MTHRPCVALPRCAPTLLLALLAALRAPGASAAEVDLSGTWRLDLVVATRAHLPVLGDIHSASRNVLLVTITRDGDGWIQRQKVCAARVEGESGLARTLIPQAFVDSLPPRSYPVTLEGDRYVADPGPESVGFRGTALPTSAKDATVVDQDHDGAPGVSVRVDVPMFGGADVWVAQRGHSVLDGRVVGPDRIEGEVDVRQLQQVTLGASNRLFAHSVHAIPDPAASRFTLTRLPDGATCADLRATLPKDSR